MATLTVWRFPSAEGADEAEGRLAGLVERQLVKVVDATSVSWPEGATKPTTRQLDELVGAGALGGAFWRLLFGLIFFVPLPGAALGAGMGELTGSLTDAGIDDDFIKSVRGEVEPGSSALFVLTADAVLDEVRDAFADLPMTLIHTYVSEDREAALRAAFAQDGAA
jgi:uncharacterized membrane protein